MQKMQNEKDFWKGSLHPTTHSEEDLLAALKHRYEHGMYYTNYGITLFYVSPGDNALIKGSHDQDLIEAYATDRCRRTI